MRRAAVVAATVALALWLVPGAIAAGWCGSGESSSDRPDIVTGAQVHAIVAAPSGSTDRFSSDANRLADDVASISTWWKGQDATRAPRYDVATFGDQTCLDISYVQLPRPASFYQGTSAFREVLIGLAQAGFADIWKDYVVYYDGPSVIEDVCGTGSGNFNQGASYAIVWLNGCPDVPSDAVQAHELLHALGALPAGAPNACTAATDPVGVADSGHPCDSSSDVLYPYADGRPLQQLVLDFNHDDYYGHTGSWDDIQDSLFLQPLGRAPGGAWRQPVGAWSRDERPPRRHLRGGLYDAMGRRHRSDTLRDVGAACTLPPLDRRLQWDDGLRAQADPGHVGHGGLRAGDDSGHGHDERQGRRRVLAALLEDVLRRRAADAARGPGQGLEVRRVERRVRRHAPHVLSQDGLRAERARELQEEALSQSRSSV